MWHWIVICETYLLQVSNVSPGTLKGQFHVPLNTKDLVKQVMLAVRGAMKGAHVALAEPSSTVSVQVVFSQIVKPPTTAKLGCVAYKRWCCWSLSFRALGTTVMSLSKISTHGTVIYRYSQPNNYHEKSKLSLPQVLQLIISGYKDGNGNVHSDRLSPSLTAHRLQQPGQILRLR